MQGQIEEIGRLFESREFGVFALSETKLKGKKELIFGGIRGKKAGVSEKVRAREGYVCWLERDLRGK